MIQRGEHERLQEKYEAVRLKKGQNWVGRNPNEGREGDWRRRIEDERASEWWNW
jgi:hypothetical protein